VKRSNHACYYSFDVAARAHSRAVVVAGSRKRRRDEQGLLLEDWAALALLAERPSHGWALGIELGQAGQFGAEWSVGRPRTRCAGPRPHDFPYNPGGSLGARSLASPARGLRAEARALLLLKLIFAARTGVDYLWVLRAQHALCSEAARSLETRLSGSSNIEKVVFRFELESALSVLRFVEWLLETAPASTTTPPSAESRLADAAGAEGLHPG
jgi:hypothetical protein